MEEAPSTNHALARWLFLRLLGLVTLIAWVSFAVQAEGLIGDQGLLPYRAWLDGVGARLGDGAVWRAPTLLWWAPGALWPVIGLGMLAALGLTVGLPAEGPLLLVTWACYLSVSTVAQRFLGFQWDTLLTETLFTALFVARFTPWSAREPSVVGVWLVRLLLVKLMWLSGAVKLASGDPGWWDGLAMTYHYETQPLPNGLSWYAHHLPEAWHRLETFATVGIELLLPLAVFAGRPGRLLGAAGFVVVLGMLLLTGNYGFFQLLTLVLCVLWVHDDGWRALVGPRLVQLTERAQWHARRSLASPRWLQGRELVQAPLAVAVLLAGLLQGAWRLDLAPPVPDAVAEAVHAARPFRTVNSYGLFADMTETRPEVLIEVSLDGRTWTEWPLPYKPGALDRRPPQVAPHMPRLDWQLWFAALSSCQRNPWVHTLLQRLGDDVPEVVALMGPYPIDAPPRFLRATVAVYRFTEPGSDAAAEGQWWERSTPRTYCPVVRVPGR